MKVEQDPNKRPSSNHSSAQDDHDGAHERLTSGSGEEYVVEEMESCANKQAQPRTDWNTSKRFLVRVANNTESRHERKPCSVGLRAGDQRRQRSTSRSGTTHLPGPLRIRNCPASVDGTQHQSHEVETCRLHSFAESPVTETAPPPQPRFLNPR